MTGYGQPPGYPPQGGGFGPPPGGYGPPPQGQSVSAMALTAIILAGVSFISCGPFTALPGMIIAKMELGKIERGESPPSNRTVSQVAFWLSIANLVIYGGLICLYAAFVLFAVGVAGATGA